MTTINNSENLIEKVGGIEKAIALEAMLQKHAVPEGWKISIINGMWHRSSVGFTHSDLRTAIAEHDLTYASHTAGAKDELSGNSGEFKEGDLVVYHSLPHKRLFKVHNKGGDSIVIRECWDEAGARCFAENSPYVDIRHATPEEIKAGHRLEAERHG